jgi:hypothetical protein
MGIDYSKLIPKLGIDEDVIEEQINDEGVIVFRLVWDTNSPNSGWEWHNILKWNGYYFFVSTDFDPEGPFDSLEEALVLEYFHFPNTPNPEIYSDVLPFKRLEQIARSIDEERQETIVINGDSYEWHGDSLR